MNLLTDISNMFIVAGIFLLLFGALKSVTNNNRPTEQRNKTNNIAILIPARDESKVIRELLLSIKNQTINIGMENVYVIVEEETDPTVVITKEENASIIVRKRLDLKRKGYAIDEALKEILAKKKYDLYFIMDADNVLDKDFIKNMLDSYQNGYDIAVGYRNCKNGNSSTIAACSALTFSMINTFSNRRKQKQTRNITISGTGFFITGDYIDKWQGYPFHSLTEDYELTLYSILNDMTSTYNEKAIFYDEQPIKYKQSKIQRTRWVKGYFEARKKYIRSILEKTKVKNNNKGSEYTAIIGVIPFILMVIGILLSIITRLFDMFYKSVMDVSLLIIPIIRMVNIIFMAYIVLMIITIIILGLEGKKIDLTSKMKIKTVFYNPLFLMSYVFCAIDALRKKEMGWQKIEHGNK